MGYLHFFDNFTEEDLMELNKKEKEGVFGQIRTRSSKTLIGYITDVKYEPKSWNGQRTGMVLELYKERDKGYHGEWLATIYDIITAKNYNSFKLRAARVIGEEIRKIEKEV